MQELFKRSFTHPLSNTIVLDKLDITEILGDLLSGSLKVEQLPQLLHEITHNWTFSSLVGESLSIIGLESKSKLLSNNSLDSSILDEVPCLEVMYTSVLTVLQPFLEGMAEFAEFDLYPSSSPVISKVSQLATFLFMGSHPSMHSNNDDLPLFTALAELLCSHRLSNQFIGRKKALFHHSLNSEKSSYLSGYLTVKNMHRFAMLKYPKFLDTDFFLLYFKAFFFDDPVFAKIILSQYKDPLEIPSIVFNYFYHRVNYFYKVDHSLFIDRFTTDLLNGKGVTYKINTQYVIGRTEVFAIDHIQFDASLERLINSHINTIFELPRKNDPTLEKLLISLFSQRGAITLGYGQIPIKIGKAGHMIFLNGKGQPMFALPMEGLIPSGSERLVDVDVLYLHDPAGLHIVVSEQGNIITSHCLNGSEISSDGLKFFLGRNEVLNAIKIIGERTKPKKEDEIFKIYFDYIKENLPLNIKRLFDYTSLLYVPDEFIALTLAKMEFAGLSSIINDEDLLHDCVVATFAAAHYIDPGSPKLNSLIRGTSLSSSIMMIDDKLEQAFGFRNFILNTEEKMILSQVL